MQKSKARHLTWKVNESVMQSRLRPHFTKDKEAISVKTVLLPAESLEGLDKSKYDLGMSL